MMLQCDLSSCQADDLVCRLAGIHTILSMPWPETGKMKFEDYMILGDAKSGNQDYGGAIECFDQAINLNPESAHAYDARSWAKKAQRDHEGAQEDGNKAIMLKEIARDCFKRSCEFGENNDFNEAIKPLDEVIRMEGNYGALIAYSLGLYARKRRAYLKEKQGDHDGAFADYKEVNWIDRYERTSRHIAKKVVAKNLRVQKNFLSLSRSIIDILNNSHWVPKGEEQLAPMHYTSCETVRSLAEGNTFRLYDAATMNDPKEGTAIFDLFNIKEIKVAAKAIQELKRTKSGGQVFVGSFVTNSDKDTGDYMMWGQYGEDYKGCALVFDPNYFRHRWASRKVLLPLEPQADNELDIPVSRAELALYNVHYIDDKTLPCEIEKPLKTLTKALNALSELGQEMDEEMWLLAKALLDMVRFLFKRKTFARESEARVVVLRGKSDKSIINQVPRRFIECPANFQPSRILLGHRVEHVQGWVEYLQEQATPECFPDDIRIIEF